METLKDRIQKEIDRLSSSHQEEDIYLINQVLRPMIEYINAHNKLMEELTRVGSKHGL